MAHALPQTGDLIRVLGTLTAVDPAGKTLTIRTDEGAEMMVTFTDSTRCLLVPPGETDLGMASPVECAGINSGDRVLARTRSAAEGEPPESEMVIVMSAAALGEKRKTELEAWRARGISGRVKSVDIAQREIVIETRTLQEAKEITLELTERTRVRRYPAGKFRFADSVPSSAGEIRAGDQLQVLGEASEDGSRIQTEGIIAGSFQTFAATVVSVDTETGELEVKDLESGKTLTVRADDSPTMRRLPERMAMLLSRVIGGQQGSGRGGAGRGGFGGGQRGGRRPGPGGGRPGGGRGRAPGGFRQILSRAPEFKLAELKRGEALIISATEGDANGVRVAITILAGVEPLLRAASTDRGPVGGNWNFEINEVQ